MFTMSMRGGGEPIKVGWHAMPKSALSEDELNQFVSSILMEGGRSKIEGLLEHCHEYISTGLPSSSQSLQPYERYFRKEIVYRDFDVHVRHFLCDGDTVTAADIQFKRPSRFPSPLLNRNRRLVAKLVGLLRQRYPNPEITVRDKENGGRQIHFDVTSNTFWWNASTPFEKWESECAIYDEPFSSGQTNPNETDIRNDFVIIRFRRKAKAEGVQSKS